MDDKERERRFRAERRAQLGRSVLIQTATYEEILHYLKVARDTILGTLASAPSQFETWRLTQLQAEVRRALDAFERGAISSLMTGLDRSWEAGSDLVTKPLAAGGIDITGQLPALDTRLLLALKSFQTDRIRDMSTTTINRVNQEIGQAAIGVQDPFEAARKVSVLMDDPGPRARMIVRTELGTAYSEAGQQRMEQAVKLGVVGLKKQWRRSGKRHPRITHELADGQIVDVDKPFKVGAIDIPKPRDPSIPAAERINCGCASLPFMSHWRVSTPGTKPYTPQEQAASPAARQVEEIRARSAPSPAPRQFASVVEHHHALTREYATWRASLSMDERRAISSYQSSTGFLINEMLRIGDVDPEGAGLIEQLDAALARARLPAPTRLWRGIGKGSRLEHLQPGELAPSDAGYFSGSISREMAEGQASGLLLEFVLPAAYPAAYVNFVPVEIVGEAALLNSEFEMLLPRGRRFRVLERVGDLLRVEVLE